MKRLGKKLSRVSCALLSELQMSQADRPRLITMIQSVIINATSPQKKNVAPVTDYTGSPPSTPISTFLRTEEFVPITMRDAPRERTFSVTVPIARMEGIHPFVNTSVAHNQVRMQNCRHKGELQNFENGDYVLVARYHFHKGERRCFRWHEPRRVNK